MWTYHIDHLPSYNILLYVRTSWQLEYYTVQTTQMSLKKCPLRVVSQVSYRVKLLGKVNLFIMQNIKVIMCPIYVIEIRNMHLT